MKFGVKCFTKFTRFGVLTAALSLCGMRRRVQVLYRLLDENMNIEAAGLIEMSVIVSQSTRLHISEDLRLLMKFVYTRLPDSGFGILIRGGVSLPKVFSQALQ
jgi:hypothetical protein